MVVAPANDEKLRRIKMNCQLIDLINSIIGVPANDEKLRRMVGTALQTQMQNPGSVLRLGEALLQK